LSDFNWKVSDVFCFGMIDLCGHCLVLTLSPSFVMMLIILGHVKLFFTTTGMSSRIESYLK